MTTLREDSIPSSSSTLKAQSGHPLPLHLDYLDGFRALAALFVLCGHIYCTIAPIGIFGSSVSWLFYGKFAVDLFIVLSGFCLMLPIVLGNGTLRGGAWAFFKKRARRILPPYYAALILSLILVSTMIGRKTGTIWDYSLPITVKDVGAHLLLVHDLYHEGRINYPLWSIAVEWQIYFLFPLLVIGWKRLGGGKTTGIAIVYGLGASFVVYHVHRLEWLTGLTFQYISLFAMGMFGAAVSFSRQMRFVALRERFPWGVATAVSIVLIILCCNIFGRASIAKHQTLVDICAGACSLGMLVIASKDTLLKNHLCLVTNWKPLVIIGTFAYSLYLVHAPLIQVLWQYGVKPLNQGKSVSFLLMIGVGVPLIIGVAYMFFLAFERPFLNTRKHEPIIETAGEAVVSPAP